MYIDTHSIEDMKKSICKYLDIKPHKLSMLFNMNNIDNIDDFLINYETKEQIDQILFFHLARRLNESIDDVIGYNLFELLTQDSSLSAFLKKYEIEFIEEQEHIQIYYKKKKQDIEYCEHPEYLKSRLGYNKCIKDYAFCGLAFKDGVYKNIYANHLSEGPEFLKILSESFTNIKLLEDYCENSKYYCYEYLIPIEKITFGGEKMTKQEKQRHLVKKTIERLYEYEKFKTIDYENNPVIMLKDNDLMQEKYFLKKEEITGEMLKN